jgi:hypothetical protein
MITLYGHAVCLHRPLARPYALNRAQPHVLNKRYSYVPIVTASCTEQSVLYQNHECRSFFQGYSAA